LAERVFAAHSCSGVLVAGNPGGGDIGGVAWVDAPPRGALVAEEGRKPALVELLFYF